MAIRKVKLDKWEKQLVDLDDLWSGNTHQWLIERNIITDEATLLSENNKLGTIGGGNHFSELQKVNEVFDDTLFKAAGIDQRSVILLVHSGSRGLGQKILQQHIESFGAKPISFTEQPVDMQQYIQRHNYAMQWAEANRELIAERFCQKLNAQRLPLLDITHNMVEPLTFEEATAMHLPVEASTDTSTKSSENYWMHRKGASPTNHGLVMIPGSRGSLSYLVKPKLDDISSLAQGGFSLAHGAGRKWKRSDVRERLVNRYKVKDLEQTFFGSRVICKQRDLLYEEAPQAYKNIDQVVGDLVGAGMVDIVATFKPLLTYKTRRTS